MPSAVPQISTGTTIAFSGGFTANILGFKPPGQSGVVLDTSHLGTTGKRTKMAGDLTDNSELTMTVQFNPDSDPPINTAQTVTITYPSGAAWVFSGWMSNYEPSNVNLEDLIQATVTVTVTGAIAITTGTTSTTAGA